MNKAVRRYVSQVLLVLVVCLSMAVQAHAQAQRMALAIGEYVASGGVEVVLRAFCIDLEREAPTEATVFRNIFGPANGIEIVNAGRTYSPSEAMRQGIGQFVGSDAEGVVFRPGPNARGDVSIKVKAPSVLSERNDPPSADHMNVVSNVLSKAGGTISDATHHDIQNTVWDLSEGVKHKAEIRKQQVILRDLGYNVGAPDGIPGPRYEAALDRIPELDIRFARDT